MICRLHVWRRDTLSAPGCQSKKAPLADACPESEGLRHRSGPPGALNHDAALISVSFSLHVLFSSPDCFQHFAVIDTIASLQPFSQFLRWLCPVEGLMPPGKS